MDEGSGLDNETLGIDRKQWNRKDILSLITIYKEHIKLFKSTTIRNEKVWKLIADKMENHTSEQCRNKWKYLKVKYMKKKDNMSDKASGENKFSFEYFDEFEEIFGNQPNVIPISTASTAKQYLSNTHLDSASKQDFCEQAIARDPISNKLSQNVFSEETNSYEKRENKSSKENKENNHLQKKHISKSAIPKQMERMTEEIEKLRQDLNRREENRQTRHQENLQQRKEATDVFKEYINFLKENREQNTK